jgi:hypothetical protein
VTERRQGGWFNKLLSPSQSFRRVVFLSWASLHLLYIVVHNILSTDRSYRDFHSLKPNPSIQKVASRFQTSTLLKSYGRYTGAETGYGFFGINVRSSGLFIAEAQGKKLLPDFESLESSVRFSSLSSTITDPLLKPRTGDMTKPDSLVRVYNELVLKNIATTLYRKHNVSDSSITISYMLLEYPRLSEFRRNPAGYSLIPVKTVEYSLKNDQSR